MGNSVRVVVGLASGRPTCPKFVRQVLARRGVVGSWVVGVASHGTHIIHQGLTSEAHRDEDKQDSAPMSPILARYPDALTLD